MQTITRLVEYEGDDPSWLSLRCQLESLVSLVPQSLVGVDDTSAGVDEPENDVATTTTRVVGGRQLSRPEWQDPDVRRAERLLAQWAGERTSLFQRGIRAEPADPWLVRVQAKYDRHSDWWLRPSEAQGVIDRLWME